MHTPPHTHTYHSTAEQDPSLALPKPHGMEGKEELHDHRAARAGGLCSRKTQERVPRDTFGQDTEARTDSGCCPAAEAQLGKRHTALGRRQPKATHNGLWFCRENLDFILRAIETVKSFLQGSEWDQIFILRNSKPGTQVPHKILKCVSERKRTIIREAIKPYLSFSLSPGTYVPFRTYIKKHRFVF